MLGNQDAGTREQVDNAGLPSAVVALHRVMNRIYEFAATHEEAIKDAVVENDMRQLEKLLSTASSSQINIAFRLGALHINPDAMEAAYSIVEDLTAIMLDAFDIAALHGHLELAMYIGNYFGRWRSPADFEDTWLRDSILENAVRGGNLEVVELVLT